MQNKTLTTFNRHGEALTITVDGITMPAESSFKCVNDYVHGIDVDFDNLVWLCLGLATEIDSLKHNIEENKTYNQPIPIETAPKDDTVLIYVNQWAIGNYLASCQLWHSPTLGYCKPSHWFPLPKTPDK